jgi:signal transduction histidine kinase
MSAEMDLTPPPQSDVDLLVGNGESDAELTAVAEAAVSVRFAVVAWSDNLQAGLTPLVQAKAEADSAVKSAKESLSKAEKSQNTADGIVSTKMRALAVAQANHEGATKARTDLEVQIERALGAIDGRWQKLVDLGSGSPIEAAQSTLTDDRAKVEAFAQELAKARAEVQEGKEQLQELASRRSHEAATPLEGIRAMVRTLTEIVNDLAGQVGVSNFEVNAEEGAVGLAKAVKRVNEAAHRAVGAAGSRCVELRGQIDELMAPAAN